MSSRGKSRAFTLFCLAVRFHLGHIFEMQNKCQLAEESYDTILEMPNVPNSVKANAYKQLGECVFLLEIDVTHL